LIQGEPIDSAVGVEEGRIDNDVLGLLFPVL
jgi:hypothetical protein